MSKYFGLFEPHALLLDGVMASLPRDLFEVFVVATVRADVKPMAPSVLAALESASHLVELSLLFDDARRTLDGLQLDILVFADTMSEPMNHFLAHSRFAKIQVSQ